MKISILEQGFGKRHPYKRLREYLFRPFWFPLDNAAYELRDAGHHVSFYSSVSDELFDCDVLVLSSRTVEALCRGSRRSIGIDEFCAAARAKVPRLVWFDTRDSAGNCQFNVMPFVDVYMKRQLYRDRSTYLKTLYGGRVFSDYYHRTHGISEDAEVIEALRPRSLHEVARDIRQTKKMKVAWSCGAEYHWPLFRQPQGQMRYFSRQYLRRFFRDVQVSPDTVSPSSERPLDVSALFDHTRYTMKSVGYQRKITLEKVRQLATERKVTGRVTRKQFYRMLSDSAVTISTFGWGEVCYREYEATYCGSAILMADMSSVEAYPDFYQAGVYYTPFAWDLSDLEEKLQYLLANPKVRIGMAEDAQRFLLAQWSRDGREAFATRFIDLIGTGREMAT